MKKSILLTDLEKIVKHPKYEDELKIVTEGDVDEDGKPWVHITGFVVSPAVYEKLNLQDYEEDEEV